MSLDSPQEKLNQRLPRNVWMLSLANLLADISAEMIRAVLPIFVLLKLGGGSLTVGEIEGVAAATVAIMRVFSGGLSDYLGLQKGLAVVGYALSTLMRSLLPVATEPLLVIGSQFGDRVGQGISVAPRKAAIADSTPDHLQGKAYRLRQTLLMVGACIGSSFAGAILFWFQNDYKLVFSAAIVPSCMGLALLMLAVKPVQKPKRLLMVPAEMTGLLAGGDDYNDRRPQAATTNAPRYNPIFWQDLPRLGGEYWLLMVVAIFFNLGNSSEAFLLLRSVELSIPPALIPLGLIAMNVVFALASYPVNVLVNHAETRSDGRSFKMRLLVIGFLMHVAIYFGLAVVSTNIQIWFLFGLYGLHLATIQGLLVDAIDRSVEPYQRGTALSLFNLTVGVTLLLANLLAGWCWYAIGSGFTFTVGALFACLATLILLLGSESSED